MQGYQSDFLGNEFPRVELPKFDSDMQSVVAHLKNNSDEYVLDYINYSLVQHKKRRFPLFTASNIDGNKFVRTERTGSWKLDDRIEAEYQWGSQLYQAEKSDFDRGHMTKREDVQWGDTEEEAIEGAKQTFFYTNAVPQHAKVNRSIWRRIEDYILKKETVKHNLRISVFTGPVMSEDDPDFVTLIDNSIVKLPTTFWKIVYYTTAEGKLQRVAFLVGQKYLLEKFHIVKKRIRTGTRRDRFINFKYADTYQVNVQMVEELSGMTFPAAIDAYHDERPINLILKSVNVRRGKKLVKEDQVEGLIL